MRLSLTFWVLWSIVASSAHAQIPGLPVIDFQRYFPHITAVSEEMRDREFPLGAQYKFLTVRDEQENLVWVAMTRREGKDRVVRLFLAKGPVEGSEATLRSTVSKFSERLRIKFEFVDLRDVRTAAEFDARSAVLGWPSEVISK
jgi:hypothetical protein